MRRLAVAVLMVGLLGCGGDDSSDRDRLIGMLRNEADAGLDEETAECVADEMIASGLTEEQLDELAEFDEGDLRPSGLDLYGEARDICAEGPPSTFPDVDSSIGD